MSTREPLFDYGLLLLPQHQELLRASGIAPEVAYARSYRSVTTKVDLRGLGFSESQCRVPALLIPVWNVAGKIVLHQIRPDEPRVVNGKTRKYETPRGAHMVVDVPPAAREWLGDPSRPLFVTEGIRKADAAVGRNVCCVAVSGVWAWRGTNERGGKVALPDWESIALHGRDVYIVFDSDAMTKREVHQALARFKAFMESRGARAMLIYLPPGEGGVKMGLDDYLAAGHDIADLLRLASSEVRSVADDTPGSDRKSQAARIVELAGEAGIELFHTPLGEPFACFTIGDHHENWPVRSKHCQRWLARLLWERTHKAASSEALQSALAVLEARALFEGEREHVHIRTAWHEGALYYDLADSEWRTVKVTANGWEVLSKPPVRFRRYSHMAAQVEPQPGGDVEKLWDFVNVTSERDRRLLKSAIITAFVPNIPRPIIVVHGEQGSGKTWKAKVLAALIDPSEAPLVRAKDEAELVQGLAHHYCAILDNLSSVPDWLSDLLCRAVTGEGFTKRQLYTDDDDIIFAYRRFLIITGISLVLTKSDILDRTLIIGINQLPNGRRKEEKVLWQEFEAERPRLFGAMLDHLAGAIREYPNVTLTGLPRMADFARWAGAVGQAQGDPVTTFQGDFWAAIDRQNEEAIAGSATATVLLAFLGGQDRWEGMAHELLAELRDRAEPMRIPVKQLPRSPSILSRRLREVRPNLRASGWEVTFSDHHHPRTITIAREAPRNDVPSVPASQSDQNQRVSEDGNREGITTMIDDVPNAAPPSGANLNNGDSAGGEDGTVRPQSGGRQERGGSPPPAIQWTPVRADDEGSSTASPPPTHDLERRPVREPVSARSDEVAPRPCRTPVPSGGSSQQ